MDSLSGPLAVAVALLDLIAIVHVWCSRIELGRKIVWSLVILLLPVVGVVMWAAAVWPFGKARL
ncbi:PLDc N-terminal domain-containing protein [Stutzerimonas stutzeri]|uniref:PLDc N-terminal domain-containing protein n=1 Tax=Stutzerimonas sp. S1 TaxID=3030652 RepID=UPI0022249E64|nr:PLDc N-terminal domain-containing protein [Stutzerimonas sp. S1]MCW3148251.1 PLDc N-terminal domain-containing protein [Stutzerimonas sp. S1]